MSNGSVAGPGLVVVGASLAGLRAVESARRAGYEGPVTLIGAEPHLPYDRPPLSKQFLTADPEPAYYTTEEALTGELGVELRLDCRASSLDPPARQVRTTTGPVAYGRLIVATGAEPRVLANVRPLEGVWTLRTLDDAVALRVALRSARKVVVVGAGFIGSEIASSAHSRGAEVTLVEAAPVPLVRAVGEVVGESLSRLHTRNGTRLICGVHVERMVGNEHVEAVRLSSGETLTADVVVVGVGAAPATSWLGGSGIQLDPRDGGIICDAYLETSLPDVYAAGDVVHWPNALLDDTVRLENWTNAADQGARAAVNALFPDRRRPHETVPYFWSDWYGHRIQFAGTAMADSVTFASGGPDEDRFVALYRRGARLVGAATLNEPRKIMKYRRYIAGRGTWAEAHKVLVARTPVPATD
ncbi:MULTISPECIES: NAD(P)/FAD-dependent oxidoreductase [unclassified Pseudofrankia]|uniref:NAD(P)/FAD-dependent oxidoreductase n=1 Tax=unclassified Pseudofrankia TaxID=2994372 RepID=UPI0008D95EDA|nr:MULTISPECIES: FAD-dependent oxidoreductase [unclassified Pseudofrankia]MDT3446635.1 FAD-dependent oxidoreductase [Pseudofrankia sp. BMG5.37]OHV58639.1 pyridine nucleotide-disulfide oxidoreductase [Pseudofrankia sp. BMG5.36]